MNTNIDRNLLSLSINESAYATGRDDYDYDDDDFMDIDSDDTLSPNKLTPVHKINKADQSTPEAHQKDKKEEFDDYEPSNPDVDVNEQAADITIEPENTSFVSALSQTVFLPTNMGAKLAIRDRLLLPSTQDRNDIDGVLNTDDYTENNNNNNNNNKSLVRHINSFSSVSDPSLLFSSDNDKAQEKSPEFIFNPMKNDYDEKEELVNNSMNQSYLYRKQFLERENTPTPSTPTPVNYNSQNSMSGMNSMDSTTQGSVQVHHHHYYYSYSPYSGNDSSHNFNTTTVDSLHQDTSFLSPINQLQTRFINNLLELSRLKLPPPWKTESLPQDKFPYVLSTYLQLIINFIVSGYGIYLIYNIIKTIRTDVNNKLSQHSSHITIEIENCRRNYYDNNCSPDLIVPALEKPCEYWLKCMNRNPDEVSNKSSISAETLGVLINSLIEPLGLKFFLIFSGFIVLIFLCNFTFGFIRAKIYYGEHLKHKKYQ